MLPELNLPRGADSYGGTYPANDGDDKDSDPESVPAHVISVQDGLLDFDHFVGLEALLIVLGDEEDVDEIPLSAMKVDGAKASQRARDIEFLESATGLADGAQKLESRFATDDDWRRLFRDAIMSRVDDCCTSSYRNPVGCAEKEVWDKNLNPFHPSLSNPNPDLYFAFPIISSKNPPRNGFGSDPSFQNFNRHTLSQLAEHGLHSSAACSWSKSTEPKEFRTGNQSEQLCFPWCILQLTPEDNTVSSEEMEDSALHAASGALSMTEKLAMFANSKQDDEHIPPVIAITAVGPKIKFSLVFSEIVNEEIRDHNAITIWNGCISKTWDALQFCRIIENMLFWSQHILRPKVSHYIDQWRLRFSPQVPGYHSKLEKDVETAELVHRIQDRLTSLNITPDSNLPDIIQQVVVFQEVSKANQEKTTFSRGTRDSKVQDETPSVPETKLHNAANAEIPRKSEFDSETEGYRGSGMVTRKEMPKGPNIEIEEEISNTTRGERFKVVLQQVSATTASKGDPNSVQERVSDELTSEIGNENTTSKPPADVSKKCPENPASGPLATSSEGFSTKKPANSPTISISDDKNPTKPPFTYPYQFKTSDFEFKQDPTLEDPNMGWIPTRKSPRILASLIASRHGLPLRLHYSSKLPQRPKFQIKIKSTEDIDPPTWSPRFLSQANTPLNKTSSSGVVHPQREKETPEFQEEKYREESMWFTAKFPWRRQPRKCIRVKLPTAAVYERMVEAVTEVKGKKFKELLVSLGIEEDHVPSC
ncbi:hypothetical protein G7Y89_g11841 [Cudoniella acicularis]|uniref:Uncharacterized protein n=1 Tax=Cudoniella acicularis TaxID=354080 RepID=A0A8H4RDT3_9HELO|nr:hypothetical protein G7Y89_g11841 [Cudoniella acicularis]